MSPLCWSLSRPRSRTQAAASIPTATVPSDSKVEMGEVSRSSSSYSSSSSSSSSDSDADDKDDKASSSRASPAAHLPTLTCPRSPWIMNMRASSNTDGKETANVTSAIRVSNIQYALYSQSFTGIHYSPQETRYSVSGCLFTLRGTLHPSCTAHSRGIYRLYSLIRDAWALAK